jgi:hypothetical protein
VFVETTDGPAIGWTGLLAFLFIGMALDQLDVLAGLYTSERGCFNWRCFGQEEDAFLAGRTGEFDGSVAEELPKKDMAVPRDESTFAMEIVFVEGKGAIHWCKECACPLRNFRRERKALHAGDVV